MSTVKMNNKIWHVISEKEQENGDVRILMQDGVDIAEGVWSESGKLVKRIAGNCYDLEHSDVKEDTKCEKQSKTLTALDIVRGNF